MTLRRINPKVKEHPKQQPNKKIFQSKTLQEEVVKESESETETFVIEPKDLKRHKKGRKVKSKQKVLVDTDSDNEHTTNSLKDQHADVADDTLDSTVDNSMIIDESSAMTAKVTTRLAL